MANLTARGVEGKLEAGLHGDGDGLYLQVTGAGSKSWVFRFKLFGRARMMGLGPLQTVPLKDARQKAQDARKLVLVGKDPIATRDTQLVTQRVVAVGAKTFRWCTEQYIETVRAPIWREGSRSADEWKAAFAAYVFPEFGDVNVQDVSKPIVLAVLKKIWNTKYVTAKRLQNRIELVLDWAENEGYRTGDNPARWKGLSQSLLLPAKAKVQKQHPSLPYTKAPMFAKAARQYDSGLWCVPARNLEFTLLTATRKSESRFAKWSEINFKDRTWTIPGDRMKGGLEHCVPLSARAIEILREMEKIRVNGFAYVFPCEKWKGRPMSDSIVMKFLREELNHPVKFVDAKTGEPVSVHGLRGTFSTFMGDERDGVYSKELIEICLAHKDTNAVAAAYQHGTKFERRRAVMEDWAKHCAC